MTTSPAMPTRWSHSRIAVVLLLVFCAVVVGVYATNLDSEKSHFTIDDELISIFNSNESTFEDARTFFASSKIKYISNNRITIEGDKANWFTYWKKDSSWRDRDNKSFDDLESLLAFHRIDEEHYTNAQRYRTEIGATCIHRRDPAFGDTGFTLEFGNTGLSVSGVSKGITFVESVPTFAKLVDNTDSFTDLKGIALRRMSAGWYVYREHR